LIIYSHPISDFMNGIFRFPYWTKNKSVPSSMTIYFFFITSVPEHD
jgi:hypothetical protein